MMRHGGFPVETYCIAKYQFLYTAPILHTGKVLMRLRIHQPGGVQAHAHVALRFQCAGTNRKFARFPPGARLAALRLKIHYQSDCVGTGYCPAEKVRPGVRPWFAILARSRQRKRL